MEEEKDALDRTPASCEYELGELSPSDGGLQLAAFIGEALAAAEATAPRDSPLCAMEVGTGDGRGTTGPLPRAPHGVPGRRP